MNIPEFTVSLYLNSYQVGQLQAGQDFEACSVCVNSNIILVNLSSKHYQFIRIDKSNRYNENLVRVVRK